LRKKTAAALDEAVSKREKRQIFRGSVKENIVPLGLIAGAVVSILPSIRVGGGWLLFFLLLHGGKQL